MKEEYWILIVFLLIGAVLFLGPKTLENKAVIGNEEAVKAQLKEMGRCSVDADCTAVMGKCPLGCYIGVNKINAVSAQTIVDNFETMCAYSCLQYQGVKCVNGFCQPNQ